MFVRRASSITWIPISAGEKTVAFSRYSEISVFFRTLKRSFQKKAQKEIFSKRLKFFKNTHGVIAKGITRKIASFLQQIKMKPSPTNPRVRFPGYARDVSVAISGDGVSFVDVIWGTKREQIKEQFLILQTF